ncbi:MAG: oxygen-independent coproporphyrinogen III oxidase [Bacteroidetes bacterium]|nr:oxygen-independent coproporphyrinogen III oxidase [Bacteroidota bacterium]
MNSESPNVLLIRKYNNPVPRYTSYPTVPVWKESIEVNQWMQAFKTTFEEKNSTDGISIYIHLPFCESLCTYCGCNKKITTNHSVEEEYMAALEKEWLLYRKLMKQTPVIRELHLGGGTPTFFSPKNLEHLLKIILDNSIIHPKHEFSIEGHPNNTTAAHLKMLYARGFRRVSFGVQDNDPAVQHIINRIQPFENVKQVTEEARKIGFKSVNFDLIYGLPLQTTESIERTINKVLELKPDRIAFYSYAHVPWTSKGQRLFDESHLPAPEDKLALYLKGKELFVKNGYTDIGMDHFALPADDLYKAWESGKLHRNFMGYTTQHAGLLIGLGVSSISDTGNAYAQNEKTIHNYYERITANELPVKKGYFLSATDQSFGKYILDISCKGKTTFREADLPLLQQYTFPRLTQFEKDGLITWNKESLSLTEQGRYFIRNICSAFDLYLPGMNEDKPVFSKAI